MNRLRLRRPEFDAERRAVLLFFFINALYHTSNSACMPFLTAHYANLGIDSAGIGVLSSLGPLSSILILPIWSRISDRTGDRRGVLKLMALGSAVMVVVLMFCTQFWQLLIVVFILFSFFNSVVPLSDALTVSHLAKTGNYRFSSVRIGGTLGFLCFVLFSGRINAFDKRLSFIICSLFLVGLFFCVSRAPQDPVVKGGAVRQARKKGDIKRVFANKKIVFMLLMACVIQIVMSFYFSFIGVYIQDLGYTSREISMSSFISAASEIPILLVIDKVLLRFNVTTIALFSGFMMVLRSFLMYNADGLGTVLLSQVGHGLTYMTLYYSCVTFINNEMDDDLKSTGQSMLAFFQTGLGSILGNVLGGVLSGKVGVKGTFFYYGIFLGTVTAVCTVFAVVMKIKARRKAAEKQPETMH